MRPLHDSLLFTANRLSLKFFENPFSVLCAHIHQTQA